MLFYDNLQSELIFRNIFYLYPLEKTAAKVIDLSKYTKELSKSFLNIREYIADLSYKS